MDETRFINWPKPYLLLLAILLLSTSSLTTHRVLESLLDAMIFLALYANNFSVQITYFLMY